MRLILCLLILVATVNCDTFSQCNGVELKTFVSSPTGCKYYIYCDDDASFEESCPTDLVFNSIDSSCDDPENVECSDDVVQSTSQTALTSTQATTLITVLPTTGGSFTSARPIVPTPGPTLVSPTSTLPTTLTSRPDEQISCPLPSRPDEVIYLPSPTSCSEYYMCYRGIPIPMTCPNDLLFDSLTRSCEWPSAATCMVVGTTTARPRDQCTGLSSGYFEYPSNCRYYYRCTNGLLTVQECPVGFGWDSYKKICTTTGCLN